MRTQDLFAVGALCGFLGVINAIPAAKYPSFVESCSVTTVYVTVAPTSSTNTLVQLPNTPVVDYGGVAKSGSAITAQSGASGSSVLGSGSGIYSTSTAHLTSTVHQTLLLTHTIIGTGVTRTETIEVTHLTSSLLPTGHTLQTYASIESLSSAVVITASGSSMTVSQATDVASGNYVYPIDTIKIQPSCSGDLVTCPETSVSNVVSSANTKDITSSQMIGSTSVPSEVYIIETLTVVPLATLPTVASSADQTATLKIQSTVLSAVQLKLTDVASSTLVVPSIVYGTGLPGTASVSSSTGSYSSFGASGWNMTVSTSSFDMSSSRKTATSTAISTTPAVDALSTTASVSSRYSSYPINFSNSYIYPNVTSSLAAESGFTALPIFSTTSTLAGIASSGGSLPSASTSSSLSQITDVAWTESYTEISSSSSVIDAVKSTTMSFNMTAGFPTSSLTVSSLLQITSEVAWTESYSEDNSATSTTDAGQSTVMSMIGTSSFSTSSTLYSSAPSFMNSTNLSGYASPTTISTSVSITSDVGSAQSTSSSFSVSTLSSPSSVSTASSSLQLPSPSILESESTTTATTINTTTSTPSLLPTSKSLTSSSAAFGTISTVSTFSGLSTSSSSSSLSSETSLSSSSWVSPAGTSESSSTTTSTLTNSLLQTTVSSTSPAEDTCTESIASSSLVSTSSATTSSILTFTTLISSTALSNTSYSTSTSSMAVLSPSTTSSTSSSSPTPTLCGERGPFTLNFDDLPPLSVKDNSTAQPMPLFSPYHQFYFSEGWSIVPPPTDPYKPSSGKLLVEFLPVPGFALGYTGALGSGKSALLGCFNFNAIGMSLGCNSTGPDCDWQFTGLRYNNVTSATDTITSQMTSTAACPALTGCDLVPVSLDNTFANLTELRINVTVAGVDKIWWLDDLHLSWFDDSCDAGLCRIGHV